jgi:hypothetical protein
VRYDNETDSDGPNTDYSVTYTRPVSNGGQEKVSLDFNICEPTLRECVNEDSNEDDFGNLMVDGKCKKFSSPDLSDVDVDLIDDDEPRKGLVLEYNDGDSCNSTHNYALQINLICDYTAEEPVYELQKPIL